MKAGRVAPQAEANMISNHFRPSKGVGLPRKSAAEPKLTRRSKVEPRLTKNAPLVDFTKPTRFSNDWMNVTKTLGKLKKAYTADLIFPPTQISHLPSHSPFWFIAIFLGLFESSKNKNNKSSKRKSKEVAGDVNQTVIIIQTSHQQWVFLWQLGSSLFFQSKLLHMIRGPL